MTPMNHNDQHDEDIHKDVISGTHMSVVTNSCLIGLMAPQRREIMPENICRFPRLMRPWILEKNLLTLFC